MKTNIRGTMLIVKKFGGSSVADKEKYIMLPKGLKRIIRMAMKL